MSLQSRAAGGTPARRKLVSLRRQVARLEQDAARYQALARAAQRTVGLAKVKEERSGKRRRKPTVRALTVARGLKKEAEERLPASVTPTTA